jgi:Putative adhesin
MHTGFSLTFALALLLLPMAQAISGERIEKSLEAAPDGVVAVKNFRGQVQVEGWARAEVSLSAELEEFAEGLAFERDGKRTRVEVKPRTSDIHTGEGSKLVLNVPAGSRVEVEGVAVDVDVRSVGSLQVRTVSGNATVTAVKGEMDLKTVSGNIRVAGSGTAGSRMKSASGDLKLDLSARELQLSTVSGDLDITLGEFDRLDASAVSGNLTLAGTLSPGGRIELATVSGNSDLQLRGTVDARIVVTTGPGGSINNRLNAAKPEKQAASTEHLATTLGAGSGSVNVSTVTGTVSLGGG